MSPVLLYDETCGFCARSVQLILRHDRRFSRDVLAEMTGEKPRVPYVTQQLGDAPGVLVAASDYLKTLPNMIAKWVPRQLAAPHLHFTE